MKDGIEIVLKGPWSSRPGEVHRVGFGPCVHVNITNDAAAFERGYTFTAGDVTLSFAQEAVAEYLPDVELVRVDTRCEYNWIPKKKGRPLKESTRVRAAMKHEAGPTVLDGVSDDQATIITKGHERRLDR